MSSKTIVCFGEILWDVFSTGKMLGGAPFNVANSIAFLGGDVKFISRIGKDELGEEILSEVKKHKVSSEFIQIDSVHDTGKVLVTINEEGSAQYEIEENAAWDFIESSESVVQLVRNTRAFIFGSLVARADSITALQTLLQVSEFSVFDLNLRPPFYRFETLLELMQAAQMLKFNDDELYEVAIEMGSPYHDLDQHIKFIALKTSTEIICVTKGMHGAVLYHNGVWYTNSGYRITVIDTVGAGDSFLATLVLGLVDGDDIQLTLDKACAMGALVAGSKGANPLISKSDLNSFLNSI